jgi:hypothetical protein
VDPETERIDGLFPLLWHMGRVQIPGIVHIAEALLTSKIFKEIGGDSFISQNFSDSLFTSLGFERIIPGYPQQKYTRASSVFLLRISRDYPLKIRTSKQPIGEILGYELIPSHPLKYPKSKQGLMVEYFWRRVFEGI